MQKDTLPSESKSEDELKQLRAIVLGKDHHLITDTVNKQAREIVGNVLSEALHDRQNKDSSVNAVLLPIVESAVDNSVTHHSDRLVSSLYPLMGSLVRKSVGAFLSDFVERTNQLIEHSFTIKGLKWRFKAWQTGVSFAQYVVAQTYNYRVEHVLLIHQETGTLLASVNLDQQTQSDADLISSMLTAINDFVGDSFQTTQGGLKEQLQTVSTDNFNLLIKPGPSAMVVAAITGNPPQQVGEQLQITLEDVHRLYMEEFEQFNGDNTPFENAENQLRDCLLTEEKNPELSLNKKPWFAWFIITIITLFLAFKVQDWHQHKQLSNQIMAIDQQPGIVVQYIDVNSATDITLDVMRDPDAITIRKWFESHNLPFKGVSLKERSYRSLSREIINRRAEAVVSHYRGVSWQWKGETLLLLGDIDILKYQALMLDLASAGIANSLLDTQQLNLNNSDKFAQSISLEKQVFNNLVEKISTVQLDFAIGTNKVTPEMSADLQRLAGQFLYLLELGKRLNINVGLLLMGSCDSSGNRTTNYKLSLMRAESTANALAELGVSREKMFVTGLGQIDIKEIDSSSRNVMFNVIHNDQVINN